MKQIFTQTYAEIGSINKAIFSLRKLSVFMALLLFTTYSSPLYAQYVVSGNATSDGSGCFTLTQPMGGQGGFVWFQNFMSLNSDFDMTFQVFLGYNDGGADGIAFVMQPNSTGAGSVGGGLGYSGISPSIAVEYDTWQNDDPWYDHIAVQRNGDVNTNSNAVAGPVQASSTSSNIEDGQWHTTQITWNATTKTLSVYFDGVFRLAYTSDIVNNTFSGNPNVYWGITGSTGGANNLQRFCVTNTNFQQILTVEATKTDITCNGNNNGTATASISGGTGPYTFLGWYQGLTLFSTNASITGLALGTYTAYYTDSVGDTANASVTINNSNCGTPPPSPTSVTSSTNPVCENEGTTLTCQGAVGTVYWYTGSCGGTLIGTGNTISVTPNSTTTYFARNFDNGFFSNICASITITPCECPSQN